MLEACMGLESNTPNLSPEARAALDAGDIDALLTFHRATFGGYVMEDNGGDAGNGDNGDQGDGDNGGDQGGDNGDQGTEGDQGDQGTDEDKRVQRANREAQRYRQQLRDAEKDRDATKNLLEQLRKALGGESTDDPAKLLEQEKGERTKLEQELHDLRTREVVRELAPKHKGDADALLDSRSFTNSLAELDSTADDYRDQVADAIKDAVKNNTKLRAGQGSGRGGTELGQGSGEGDVTPEQFARMGYKQRAELFASNPTLYRKLADAIK